MKFDKYYNVYDNYSIVQKKVAENLSNFIKNSGIENKKIETIFEIGCGTGIFTKKYMELFKESKIFLNDIFDTKEFFENYSYNDFICGDIEEIKIDGLGTVILTHGHLFDVKRNMNSIYTMGVEKNANMVIFGHTHIQHLSKFNNILFVNPGAIVNHEYAIYQDGNIEFKGGRNV